MQKLASLIFLGHILINMVGQCDRHVYKGNAQKVDQEKCTKQLDHVANDSIRRS